MGTDDEIQLKKPAWQSKTMWIALVNAAVAFVPPVQKMIAEHPEGYAIFLSVVFGALRKMTKGRISIL